MQVVAQLVGESPLPWEGDRDSGSNLLRGAGRLRDSVLQLLHRDASQRLAVADFVAACSRFLETTSTTPQATEQESEPTTEPTMPPTPPTQE